MATPPKQLTPNIGYRGTMRFSDGYQAITETHALAFSPGSDLASFIYPQFKSIMTLRAACMGAGVVPVSLRVSVAGNPRVYYPAPASDIAAMTVISGTLAGTPTAAEIAAGAIVTKLPSDADIPNVAVTVKGLDSTYALHTQFYMAGLPDVFVSENPASPPVIRVSTVKDAMDSYWNALITGKFGWLGKIPVTSAGWGYSAVIGVSQNPTTGNFQIITNAAIAQTPQAGNSLQLQGFQMISKSYLSPNGTWQIRTVTVSGTQYTYELNASANVQASLVYWLGQARPVGYMFNAYAKLLLGVIATRKRGGSGLAPRGRRKSQVRVSS